MSQDKERQLRLHFLDEAQEYLNAIELGAVRLSSTKIDDRRIDGILRAAHSIKGSAAMMGYEQLSHFAHRLEDFFKVIKLKKAEVVDGEVERLLLNSVDRLSSAIEFHRQEIALDKNWLEKEVSPIFQRLQERLGDPEPDDVTTLLTAEMPDNLNTIVFATEVEECLQNLETTLATGNARCLSDEVIDVAQMLSGLGEMLELPAFVSLCQSAIAHLPGASEVETEAIAQIALQQWRRAQALVLVGQTEMLPTQIELNLSPQKNIIPEVPIFSETETTKDKIDELNLSLDSFQTDADRENVEFGAIEAFSGWEEIIDAEINDSSETKPSQPLQKTAEVATEEETDTTIRVAVGQLEQLSELFGEVAIERNALKMQLKNMRYLVGLLDRRVKKLEQSNFRLRVAYDRATTLGTLANSAQIIPNPIASDSTFVSATDSSDFDVLELDRYHDIHLLSGDVMESVVQVQEVSRDLDINLDETERNARQLNRTTKQMENAIASVRMRPLADLVERFPRALRDMELQYGKQVELTVKGGTTLIERSILEALNDPLLHLLRNAFDHGIESESVRRSLGKPERGSIAISAAYRGNQTIVTVSDDGGGINLDKIRARALEIGLDVQVVTNASDSELLGLIFEPGFSTAAQITNLSGRGVGMDVVRTNIEKVKGKVEVSTEFGVGTTFTITVPFSLSVMRVLLVESNGMLLAFPTNSVEEVLLLAQEKAIDLDGFEAIELEGASARLIRLGQWFKFSDRSLPKNSDEIPAIDEPAALLIKKGKDFYAIQIDCYWREEEVTIRQVEGFIKMPVGFNGCTILGDGRVVPLVYAFGVIDWFESLQSQKSLSDRLENSRLSNLIQDLNQQQPPLKTAIAKKTAILVIDDSINVRHFLAMILEKANYKVEQAKDGQEALEKLLAGHSFDTIICDIEMPRLDGYGFLSKVKANPECKNIPIMMLTSRTSDKHRSLAMNLGADAYLNKPFQELELLQALEELTS
jgi:two-component system, chemotaxis family, sensor histidine kinase and response regulator PixL